MRQILTALLLLGTLVAFAGYSLDVECHMSGYLSCLAHHAEEGLTCDSPLILDAPQAVLPPESMRLIVVVELPAPPVAAEPWPDPHSHPPRPPELGRLGLRAPPAGGLAPDARGELEGGLPPFAALN